MCINILQNIKAVGGDSRTNHVSIYIRTDEQNDLSPTTSHFENTGTEINYFFPVANWATDF
jgi:hypothetical protein